MWTRLRAAGRAAAQAWRRPTASGDLTEVLEHSVDGVVQVEADGTLSYLNPAARALLRLPPRGALGPRTWARHLPAGTRAALHATILPALQTRGVWLGEFTLRLGPRRHVPFSLMALAHPAGSGGALRYSAVMRDIAADVQARQQIQRQNEILGAITEALPATVVIVDSQGRYRFVNSAFERYVGRSAAQILGCTAIEVLGAEEVARRRPYMQKAFTGEAVDFTLDYPGPEGTTHLSLSCIPLKLEGRFDGFVGISQDITVQRREQERLAHLAERDPLTGLLNRAGLALRLQRQRRSDDEQRQALLYIDLDHFKPVNDQWGHGAGDRVLQLFAQRLGDTVRSSDVVARLGGDEFAILLSGGCTLEAAQIVADKVLAAARLPFEIGGHSVGVGASIGVALQGPDDGGLDELLQRADRMLYRAKAAGRGRQAAEEALSVD